MKKLLTAALLFFAAWANAQAPTADIMPYPKKLEWQTGSLRITPSFTIQLQASSDDAVLQQAVNEFLRQLNKATLAYIEQEEVVLNAPVPNAVMQVQVNEKAEANIGTDESYHINITNASLQLSANNTIGALRGLQTVLQLLSADTNGYCFPALQIEDAPRFAWRGMMVDAARHFIPMQILLRHVDAMAMVKMNVLHLHLSDDEGFRVESKIFPKLQQLSSNGEYYTQQQLKELVQYAAAKGIIVYPEFDLPGHSRSWFAAYPELASTPGLYKPGPRFDLKPGVSMAQMMKIISDSATPTIDPTKESTYRFLDKLIGEMATVFPSPYLHIGADENNGAAWKQNPAILQFMQDKNIKDVHELQAYFVKRMYAIAQKHRKRMIGWEELYNPSIAKDVIVQFWIAGGIMTSKYSMADVTKNGNSALISKGFYLDLFMPSHIHYLNAAVTADSMPNVLGGEAALWSEVVDENTFEARAWPRTAAIAERLWSPASVNNVDDMYRRLFITEERLQMNGLQNNANLQRMLLQLCNGQDIAPASALVETLSPLRGYKRIMGYMTKPKSVVRQSVPLVNLQDVIPCDSKAAWQFRKQVEMWVATKDSHAKDAIVAQLTNWYEAAIRLPGQAAKAPNLKSFLVFADRLVKATQIGMQAVNGSIAEADKANAIEQLKAMKRNGDDADLNMLSEIEALVSGKLAALPMSFSIF